MHKLNPESEYIAMRPRFSHDFTKLVYLGSDTKFLSHTGNYQLRLLTWPCTQNSCQTSETLIDRFEEYPEDD